MTSFPNTSLMTSLSFPPLSFPPLSWQKHTKYHLLITALGLRIINSLSAKPCNTLSPQTNCQVLRLLERYTRSGRLKTHWWHTVGRHGQCHPKLHLTPLWSRTSYLTESCHLLPTCPNISTWRQLRRGQLILEGSIDFWHLPWLAYKHRLPTLRYFGTYEVCGQCLFKTPQGSMNILGACIITYWRTFLCRAESGVSVWALNVPPPNKDYTVEIMDRAKSFLLGHSHLDSLYPLLVKGW
jgi:hypothetical protein